MIKFLLIVSVVVLISLPQPYYWFNLPYLLGIWLVFRVNFRNMFWIFLTVLILADILNLRTLGFSVLVVGLTASLVWWVYQKYLPHNKWTFGFSVLVAYVIAVESGIFLSKYL